MLTFIFFSNTEKYDAEMCYDTTCIAHVYNKRVN